MHNSSITILLSLLYYSITPTASPSPSPSLFILISHQLSHLPDYPQAHILYTLCLHRISSQSIQDGTTLVSIRSEPRNFHCPVLSWAPWALINRLEPPNSHSVKLAHPSNWRAPRQPASWAGLRQGTTALCEGSCNSLPTSETLEQEN